MDIKGPEAIAIDFDGNIITGLEDGRVIRITPDLNHMKTLGNTGGRPAGIALHPDGRIIIADCIRGLLALNPLDGSVYVLATHADGEWINFANDVAISGDGRFAYFSHASARWNHDQSAQGVMEHSGDGRLIRHEFATGHNLTLLRGLEFANGVALCPEDSCILISETSAYRLRRLWLKGNQAGHSDILVDNLPGLPDNVTVSKLGNIWLALYSPRLPVLDSLAQWPRVRKALIHLMDYIPRPVERTAIVLAFNSDGQLLANLQDEGPHSYSPITSVRERDGVLYFGSLSQTAIARLNYTVGMHDKN